MLHTERRLTTPGITMARLRSIPSTPAFTTAGLTPSPLDAPVTKSHFPLKFVFISAVHGADHGLKKMGEDQARSETLASRSVASHPAVPGRAAQS